MASLAKLVWSSLRRVCNSDDGASTSSSAATTSCAGGPSATRIPCNPETGVGLLAAVEEPFRSGTYGIMTVGGDLSCTGTSSSATCCGTLEMTMHRVDWSCRLCSHRVDGAVAYMYMDMVFCSRRCRFDYSMEALYDERHMTLTGTPAGNQMNAAMKESLVSTEEKKSLKKAFFDS